MSMRRTLVLGWGNPARGDDGIGPAIVTALAAANLESVDVAVDYQLQIEHAADLAGYERVIFVDADRSGRCSVCFGRLTASHHRPAYTSHALQPAAVLGLAEDLFGDAPEAWLLAVGGESFGLGERLSPGARQRVEQAGAFLETALRSGFNAFAGSAGAGARPAQSASKRQV